MSESTVNPSRSVYIFTAYKQSSEAYCRNCLMASYESDFYSLVTENREELIEAWGDYLSKNYNFRQQEKGYEFLIIKDGIVLFNELNCRSSYEEIENEDKLRNDIYEIRTEAEKIAKKKHEEKTKKEHLKAEEARKLNE